MTHTDVNPPNLTSSPVALDPKRWLALAVLLLAAAMDLIGMTIATMALPAIEADLHGGHAVMEWVIAGYGLAFAVGLISGGRLGDVYGRRRVFILGVVAFTAASAVCGLAPTVPVLVGARVLQGLFAALMIPQVLSTVSVIFPTEERAKAFGLFGAVAGLATVVGPLLGGLLLEGGGLGWRSIFLVNVPLGIAVSIAAMRLVPDSRAGDRARLDLAGVGLSAVSVALLLVPLVEGPQRSWPPALLAMLAASVPAFLVLAVHQRRREQRGASPLVPPSLFRHRSFVAGTLAGLTFFSAPPALFFVLAITLQDIGFSPLHTALTFVPLSLASVPAAGAAIVLAPKLGRRLPIGGAVVVITGTGLLVAAVSSAGAGLSSSTLLPGLIVAGLGLGLVSPTLIEVVLRDIPSTDAGAASGVLNTILQLGGAIGIALIGLVFFGSLPGPSSPDLQSGHIGALTNSLRFVFAVVVLSAISMLLLPRHASGRNPVPTPRAPTETTTHVHRHQERKLT